MFIMPTLTHGEVQKDAIVNRRFKWYKVSKEEENLSDD